MNPNAPKQLLVKQIPIESIVASATNPRKHYDQAALEELAASIKAVGIQVPLSLRILVGTEPETFEIVGGERRWRAAQLAGLSSVPAICRVMTDAECREAQLVDNLQRADLTPMEEAECYSQLFDQAEKLPVEVLAAKAGKTVQHVTQRLRLLQLIPSAREALRQGVLNLTLALLIARLDPDNQVKAALYAVDPQRFMQGDLGQKIAKAKDYLEADNSYWRCATETQMREWIKDHTLLPLKPAAWDLADAELLPEAGACTACPKRSGNASMLFGDLAGNDDTCTDPECYRRKEKAFVKIQLKADPQAVRLLDSESHLPLKEGATSLKQGQWIIAKAKSCPAVLVGITENGKRLHVCPDQKCKVHKHQVQQPMKAGGVTDYEADRKAREAKEQAYVEAERPIRLILWAEIRAKLKGPKLFRAVLRELMESRSGRDLAALRGIPIGKDASWETVIRAVGAAFEKAKDADLEGWLLDVIGACNVLPNNYNYNDLKRDRASLWALGELVGVDCDAIAKKAAPAPVKAKAEPARPSEVVMAAAKRVREAAAKPAKKSAPKKLSAEGRKRIADAMRKRWAANQKKAVRK